jgi:hypothetical protein
MSAIVALRSGRSGRITPLMAGDGNPQCALLVMEPIEDDAASSE